MKTIKELAQRQLEKEGLRVSTDIFDVDVLYANYSGSTEHIDDVVNEIAGSSTPIYEYEWIEKFEELYHEGYLDRAIDEMMATDMQSILGCGYDLYALDMVYENLDVMIRCYILNTLKKYDKIVTKEEFEDILNILDDVDHYSIRFVFDIDATIDNVIYDVLSEWLEDN